MFLNDLVAGFYGRDDLSADDARLAEMLGSVLRAAERCAERRSAHEANPRDRWDPLSAIERHVYDGALEDGVVLPIPLRDFDEWREATTTPARKIFLDAYWHYATDWFVEEIRGKLKRPGFDVATCIDTGQDLAIEASALFRSRHWYAAALLATTSLEIGLRCYLPVKAKGTGYRERGDFLSRPGKRGLFLYDIGWDQWLVAQVIGIYFQAEQTTTHGSFNRHRVIHGRAGEKSVDEFTSIRIVLLSLAFHSLAVESGWDPYWRLVAATPLSNQDSD